jgi:hypothetical protein
MERMNIFILAGALATSACSAPPKLFDPARAEKAEVVLRVRAIRSMGADKYAFYEVAVIQVFKNSTGVAIGKTVQVAAYSWKSGVPPGESTLYLERYNKDRKDLENMWRLIGGDASSGVSHSQKG